MQSPLDAPQARQAPRLRKVQIALLGSPASNAVESQAMMRYSVTLLPLLAALTAVARNGGERPRLLDVDRLARAVEQIESGGKNHPPYWDVNGYAFGLYGMHLPRWTEIGGTKANWGTASPALQRKLFRSELKRRKFATLLQFSRWHNGSGNGHREYAKRLDCLYNSK